MSFQFKFSSISTKLIWYLFIVSSCITIVLTATQLYLDYNRELKLLESSFIRIEKIFIDPLASSIWSYDEMQIQKQLEGILFFDQVAKIELTGEGISPFFYNNDFRNNGPSRIYEIKYKDQDTVNTVGKLNIVFTLDKIYGDLLNRFLFELFGNFIKTAVVSLFVLYFYFTLVTQPLSKIAEKSRQVRFEQTGLIASDGKKSIQNISFENELDEMSYSITTMQQNFLDSYRALQNSESKLKDIVEYGFDYVFETDNQLKINFVHSKSNADLYLNETLVKDNNLADLPFTSEQIKNIDSKTQIRDQKLVIQRNQQNHYYSFSIKPIFENENSQQIQRGYRGFLVDITERVLAEEKIKQQEEQIVRIQKSETIGELAAGIAHDFNNLLSIITGNVSILEILTEGQKQTEQPLKSTQDAVFRGQKLIQRLFTFSRKHKIEIEPVDFKKFILNIQDLIQVAVGNKVKLEIDLSKDLGWSLTDPNQLENSIINICINARDAMDSKGTLRIQARHTQKIVQEKPQEMIQLDFIDSGIGMSDEVRSKMFEAYFTTKPPGKGTGLGLSMVYRFIQDSKGLIEVQSELGKGTTISFFFPKIENS